MASGMQVRQTEQNNVKIQVIPEAATGSVLRENLFLKFRNIHRKTPDLVS